MSLQYLVYFFICSVFLSVGPLLRADTGFLSLPEVLTSVDLHYPLIQYAEAELRKASADLMASQGGFDPLLKATYSNTFVGYYSNSYTDLLLEQPTPAWGTKVFAGWRSGQGTFPIYEAKSATFTGGEVRAGVEVPLLKGGSIDERRARILGSEQGLKAAEDGLQSQRLEIRKQAAQKYWDWISSGRKVGVAKEALDIALGRDEAIRKRIKHGDLAEIDQVENQRAIVQRRATRVAAERAFQKAALELSIYWRGREGHPLVEALSRLPKVFLIHEFQSLSSSVIHPELRKIGSQIRQVEIDFRLAQNQLLPKLDLQLGVYSDLGVNSGVGYLPYVPYLPPTQYPTEMRVSLGFELPLFFRGSRGKYQASQAALDKVEAIQELTRNKLSIQAKDSLQAMGAAHEKLKLAQEEIRLSSQLEDSEKKRAFHGDSSFLLVNLREQTTRDAMGKEIDAYSEFYKARADYEAAVGEISNNT